MEKYAYICVCVCFKEMDSEDSQCKRKVTATLNYCCVKFFFVLGITRCFRDYENYIDIHE